MVRYRSAALSPPGEMIVNDLIGRGKRRHTALQWGSHVDRFVALCGDKAQYDRTDVVNFVGSLRAGGMKQTTIIVTLRAIRLLSQIQKWDMPKLSMPKVKTEDIHRPLFTAQQIKQLIKRAKEVCSDQDLAYLALATVYGLRREEISTVEIGATLRVKTAKGGSTVCHLIPEGLRSILQNYKPMTIHRLSEEITRIIIATGATKVPRSGWHSIRRSLATELIMCDVSMLNILRFMRWSDASMTRELGMLSVYAKKDQERIDLEVFRIHPFLNDWIGYPRDQHSPPRETGHFRELLLQLADEFEKGLIR